MNTKNDLKTQIIYSLQDSKKNIRISAFRYIPVRYAKAFFKLFFALSNPMYWHRV
jgi:hypothetical protein